MASGIVSSGCELLGWSVPSLIMLWVALLGGAVLTVVLLIRLILHSTAVATDARNPSTCFGFFTIVAGANVLGVRLDMSGLHRPALALGIGSALIWLFLTYGLPSLLLMARQGASVLEQVNGSWFLWVVGTQSLATAAASAGRASGSDTLAAVAVALWGFGVALYLLITTVVVLRLLAAGAEPGAFGPAYWIAMGATAITALAGSQILRLPEQAPVMHATRGFVSGTSYVMWAVGLWWVPLLVIIGVWRHLIKKYPLRYDTQVWSIVFPLGMFGVSSVLFGESEGLAFMHTVGAAMIVVACVAWLLAAAQMIFSLTRPAARLSPGDSP